MIKLTNEITAYLSDLLTIFERQADLGRVNSDNVMPVKMKFRAILKKYNIEYCSHNLAILGSQRYKKEKLFDIDCLLSVSEYKKISR